MEPSHFSWMYTAVREWIVQQPFIGILISLMLIDTLTGIIAAGVSGKATSSATFRGIQKKMLMFLMVATGMVMELLYPDIPWGRIVAMFFCVYEIISITENAGRAGLPLPKQLTDALQALRQPEAPPAEPTVHLDIHTEQVQIPQPPEESIIVRSEDDSKIVVTKAKKDEQPK